MQERVQGRHQTVAKALQVIGSDCAIVQEYVQCIDQFGSFELELYAGMALGLPPAGKPLAKQHPILIRDFHFGYSSYLFADVIIYGTRYKCNIKNWGSGFFQTQNYKQMAGYRVSGFWGGGYKILR